MIVVSNEKYKEMYELAMVLLDEIHQELEPLVCMYDSTPISANIAKNINQFKQKMNWRKKDNDCDEF